MTSRTRRVTIVAVSTLFGALAGAGAGAALTGDIARYESSATVAVVPAAGLPEDLAADFWQVLSEEQVVRTAASIYDNDRWAADAARAVGVPASEVELSASALVDTTLIEVTVETGTAATADAAMQVVLASASVAASEILAPFVLSEAAVRPAEASRSAPTMQLIGAAGVAGALLGAGLGLVLASIRRRGDGPGGGREPEGKGESEGRRKPEGAGEPGYDGDDDEVGDHVDEARPRDAQPAPPAPTAGRHSAGADPSSVMSPP